MPGSTPSRSSKNCYVSLIPMSERQQMKLVRQLEISDGRRGNSGFVKDLTPNRPRSRSCNGRGETPLHKAAIKGDEELVIKLLEEGADPNVPDFAGWTPLHEACNHGWYAVALALIQAGASVNARGLDDDTPLHDAAINGHTRLVQLLIEQGADVNSRNKGGKTPCDVAAPGLMPHLLKHSSVEEAELRKNSNVSSGFAQEDESTALPEMRHTTPQSKGDSGARVNLKLQAKKRQGKTNPEGITYSGGQFPFPANMEEKGNKEDIYEFKSSKEATPVRGNSTSPEVEKNCSETKNEKSGDGYPATETDSSSSKRTLSETGDNEEAEDETKKKKRKEGDGGKVREEIASSAKTAGSGGRTTTVRNVNNNSEKGGKVSGHALCKNSGANSKTVLSSSGASANSDRKSPSSPKPATPLQHTNQTATPSAAGKSEGDQEDKSVVDGEKSSDQAPKVPPLKIVIPQQTTNEPEPGNRNGKNGTLRHHQALPYVVSSNSNDDEKEGLRSRSASPTDSCKSDEKKDPAIGMLSAEDQKNSLHHQRVLRSAHRSGSGPNNNGESRATDATAPRSNNGNGQSAAGGSNLTATNNNASSSAAVASSDNPSPQAQSRTSPLPQVDSNSSTSGAAAVSNDNSSTAQNSSNYKPNSSTPSKNSGGTSSGSSASTNYEEKSSEGNSEPSQAPPQTATPNPAPVELHPRKRKLKHNKSDVKETPLPQVTTERCESATTSTEIHPHEQPVKNCYQLFLDIRKQIERRRKGLFPVQPKPPQGFKDYLMNRCTYVLAGNASTRQIPTSPLPQNLSSPMKDLFTEQEKERHRLRLQHVIEKEKLVLSVEQEILRVHGRAARALANQSLPFSACTILKDEEVYNLITPEQEEKDRNARSRYNGRLFLSWLQDVDDKWEKIKEAMLLRHHNEAESLHAVQKMDWEWKMKELGSCEFKSKPVILENHVPMVHVSDDFDLLPA